MVTRRLVLMHQFESALLFQAVINKSPGAVLLFIHLALAVISAAAGSIDQPFVASRDGTNTGRFAEEALTTLGTSFAKEAGGLFDTDE